LPSQHTTEEMVRGEGIFVPLDLSELHILKQEWQADGTIRVEVIATTTQVPCPNCQKTCVKIHDTRARKKRDVALREHQVELILYKRRFRCFSCQKTFTEPDTACGRKRRKTERLRKVIGKHVYTQPVAHVAKAFGVSHHLVQQCFETVATQEIKHKGLNLDEQQPLCTPRFLGIDEFARRKGHVYETILCDLDAHRVIEVCSGRKLEEVTALLERLSDPDAVEAVSMDMSASCASCGPTLFTQGTNRRRSLPCHPTCDERVQKNPLQLDSQKRREAAAGRQTASLSQGKRGSHRGTSERAHTHWGTTSLAGESLATQRRVTHMVCHRYRCNSGNGARYLDREGPTAWASPDV
jgi:transposase